MPHADSSLVPEDIKTKAEFYAHVHEQLTALLEGHRFWVSNLAQASALLYHAYLGSALYGFAHGTMPVVNWCGFYVRPAGSDSLVLGPYAGRPACVTIKPQAGKGVCADAYLQHRGLVVPDVDKYPGHIACDGDTKSEVVVPLTFKTTTGEGAGVLDLDSTVLATFDDEDLKGLEEVVRIVCDASDWP